VILVLKFNLETILIIDSIGSIQLCSLFSAHALASSI